ncbi:hypothetical protein [Spiroplasma endosymbiont of Lonchoptera lutea]|uniref:hypothetical protein n=1 Tax=Spiroplasma endosymbiont of Lonchoptera lutea TaxID=3066297 RepID=UPI0030D14758
MTNEQLKIYGDPSQKMNAILEIHQQLKEIFKNFQFNNEKDCIEILLDEECSWNTTIDVKNEITFYITHKTITTSNVLLMCYEWYHWEMPSSGYRFTKRQISQFKQDFPRWKDAKYFLFSKAIKHFITQKWDLIDKNDFYFDLGFILFKQIFPGFHLRLIPTFRYFHFDNYSLRSKKTYLEGIFYRLRSRDFYTRFPQIEIINIQEKNKITNTYYLQTLRLVKWLYYQMSMKNNHLANSHFNIPLNKYYLFDYLLYPVYYKYFLKDNPLQRCFDVIREVLQRIIIKYDSIYLPNNLIAFWELEIDNEELQYTLEHLLEYINEHYSEEHAYEEIYEEVQNFVEYMESLEPKEKKH